MLAARRGGGRVLARARHRVRRPPAAERAGVTDRAAGRRRRGRARQGVPAAPGGGARGGARGGLAAYERGDFFVAHELLEPAWMGTDDPGRARAPPGPDQARRGLRPRRPRQPGRASPRTSTGARGAARRGARRPGPTRRRGHRPRRRSSPTSTRRLADLAAHPTEPDARRRPTCTGAPHDACPARSRPSTSPRPSAASARTRRDRSCSTSASRTSSPTVRAPGALLIPMSTFMARVGELPTDRPLLVICHVGRPVGGGGRLPDPRRADGRGQRGGRDGRLGAGRAAGPARARRAGRGRAPGLTPAPGGRASAPAEDPGDERPGLGLVGERPADEDQDDEVDGADAGRVQVAELLADLALDLEPRHGRPDEAELEERRLRGEVRPDARCRRRRRVGRRRRRGTRSGR